jgi:hypothetical protein
MNLDFSRGKRSNHLLAYRFEGGILTEASKRVAQLRRGNRGPRHAYTNR